MAVNKVDFRKNLGSADTNRGPSPNVWADCPVLEIIEDPSRGFYLHDDFRNVTLLTTPTITTQAHYAGPYKAFGSAGGTLLPASIEGGSGLVFTETDDDQGVSLATIALPFKISQSSGKFWTEARLKTNNISNTEHGFFLGLLESATLSSTVPIAAAGTLADQNLVGFHRLEGDGDQIDTVYKANTVTQVTVQEDALSTALVADTYVKLGMRYDPTNYEFSWYVNNLKLTSTKTVPSSAGTDFPNDVQMGLVLAVLCASNNDAVVTLDWWRAAQLF